MPKFKDALGRVWILKITTQTLESFEEQTGASLFDQKTLNAITAGRSVGKLSRLAYLATRRQRLADQKLNITFEEFTDAIEDGVQLASMVTAVTEAINAFSQSLAPEKSGAPNTK